MSDEDRPSVQEQLQKFRDDQLAFLAARLREYKEPIGDFLEAARKKGVNLTSENIEFVPTIGVVARYPSLVQRLVAPEGRDHEGLYPLDDLVEAYRPHSFQAGYLHAGNCMLMAHPCFRRAMNEGANFAPRFVDLFWGAASDNHQRYIALDEDRVRVEVGDGGYFEADTWFGPPFNDDISKIDNGIAKLRPPSDIDAALIRFLFAELYCLDIKWSQSGDIKTFQALEIKSSETKIFIGGEQFHPARYIHAEFDVRDGAFRHFDGAVQYFTESEYLGRRDSDFNHNLKDREQIKARSRKLFKLNGRIETEQWVELCSHFLAGNPLMFEYFTGKYPPHLEDNLRRIRDRAAEKAARSL